METDFDRIISQLQSSGEEINARWQGEEMGCLRIYPGSHKLGRVENSDGSIANEVLAQHPIENATIIEAEKGDVIFFHYFTLHGSMPNRSQLVRKTVLTQLYSGSDDIESTNHHPNARLVLRGWNHAAKRSQSNEF